MNRINKVLDGEKNILSIYFTAGYPNISDTEEIITQLSRCDVDMIEIGLPFSDPLADGPTIQESSTVALNNGMNSVKLFHQLKDIRKKTNIPLIIMGYFNPILQFGVKDFCKNCQSVGIDGLIIPDLPVEVYEKEYKSIFDKHGLLNMFLITPQTSNERIRFIDKVSKGFIYMVSSFSITGAVNSFNENQKKYFKRINSMKLKSKLLIGFGISNNKTFIDATENSKGAIIGSAFIKFLKRNDKQNIDKFINSIRNKSSGEH
tara:strand:- start:549 stop:1331 length:783 start_codon:yes stop_codon:yes gene_type:complete